MKSIFTVLFLVVFFQSASSQELSDTIEVQRSFGVVLTQHGQKLRPRDLVELTRPVPEAYQEMRIAKSNYDASQVFGYIGGFLVGWPLGTALAGGKPNWTLAAAGAGLIVISIPFSSGYSKHALKSIAIYNSSLKQSVRNDIKMKIGFAPTGIRVRMKL